LLRVYSLCQVISTVKVGRGEVTVRRFESQRDEGQREFLDVQDFFRGQRLHNRALVWADNDRAFFFQGEAGFSNRRSTEDSRAALFLAAYALPENANQPPQTIRRKPPALASQNPLGMILSASTNTLSTAIPPRFITPIANRSIIKSQQQPRQ